MITLTSQFGLPRALGRIKPSKLISLLDPESMIETPVTIQPSNHLRIGIHDLGVAVEGFPFPRDDHIETLLEFGSKWGPDEGLIVHCAAGQSRSPAAILILLVQKNRGREFDIAAMVRRRAPQVRPNTLMIEIGDHLLGCHGRLIAAVKDMKEPTLHDFQDRHVSFQVILRRSA